MELTARQSATAASGDDPWTVVRWTERELPVVRRGGERERVEAPESWSDLAVSIAAGRYFLAEPGGVREHSVRQMVERVVRALGDAALAGGHLPGEPERRAFEAELIRLVLLQRGTFATPVWLNLGTHPEPITAACFIFSVEDSIESLLDWNAREARAFQQGAGAGANLSRVRGSMEPVSRGGTASGPVSFMRGADAWAGTIRAGGRARRGAKMVVLDADHPDVLEFIRAKAVEERRVRELVTAGHSAEQARAAAAFEQSDHSVRVTEAFMRAATSGGRWELRAVRTGEVVRRMPAAELLGACAEAAWECGDPGLQFEDTINAWNTCPASGRINASNPCGEFMHLDNSACNLATLNLLAFLSEENGFECDAFVHAIDTFLLAQDVLVSCSGYPSPETREGALRFRQLGLGYSNLGALLLCLGLPYDSDEARDLAAAITALLGGAAYRRSAELAKMLGPFAGFRENREPMLAVIERHRHALAEVEAHGRASAIVRAAASAWDEALERGRRGGFRNAQTTLIAPTGTVSLTMDCETTGVEPYYSLGAVKHFRGGGSARLDGDVLSRALRRLGYTPDGIAAIEQHVHRGGHAAGAPGLNDAHRPIFATAVGPDAIAPSAHVAMVAAVQPFVSGGVSKTVNMPANATVADVKGVFVDAWRSGLKAIAVYRAGSKVGQPLEEKAP